MQLTCLGPAPAGMGTTCADRRRRCESSRADQLRRPSALERAVSAARMARRRPCNHGAGLKNFRRRDGEPVSAADLPSAFRLARRWPLPRRVVSAPAAERSVCAADRASCPPAAADPTADPQYTLRPEAREQPAGSLVRHGSGLHAELAEPRRSAADWGIGPTFARSSRDGWIRSITVPQLNLHRLRGRLTAMSLSSILAARGMPLSAALGR